MAQRPIEIVERKGIGHPDTICDLIAEELSRGLSAYYLEHFGRILHHNVDKALLVGGQTRADFGEGEIIDPMRLILSGRATREVGDHEVPVSTIAHRSARQWLKKNVPDSPEDACDLDYQIKPGSADLQAIVNATDFEAPRANDTSLGVAHWPLSETERLVLEVEKVVREFAPIGPDVKVMALRHDDKIDLTVATAFVASRTPDVDTYMATKHAISHHISEVAASITGCQVMPCVNCGDIPRENKYYLTVTGTSAEAGDDGEVGRGNRINGLITPFRPMSMEAVAGKNPVSHIGKIYNRMAQMICERVVERVPGSEVLCYMLSQIGSPITEPLVVHVEATGAPISAVEGPAREAVKEVVGSWAQVQQDFVQGKFPVA
jgi:S-adenosylmethionine synthetase